MAGTAGSGTAGANQDGTTPLENATAQGARTPGEVIFTGQGAAHSAAAGPNIDTSFVDNYVLPAFDLAVKDPLRDRLIWDQFVTWKPSGKLGENITAFLGDDIDEAGATVPLVENLDVDSVTFGSWAMQFSGDEFGRAVSRTRLAQAKTAINIDPMIVDRVAWDAARAQDALARNGLLAADGSLKPIKYLQGRKDGTGTTARPSKIEPAKFLDTTSLQIGATVLDARSVLPFRNGSYILLVGPQGAQHLKNERDTGGFRYVTARNEGSAGNSIYNGTIGMTEGVEIVVSNRVPAGKAYLMGRDALAKTFLNSEGYGESPSMVVAPVIDKMRRFLSWGWLHFVGYAGYDARSMIEFEFDKVFRPAGAAGLNTTDAVVTNLIATGTAKAPLEKYFANGATAADRFVG